MWTRGVGEWTIGGQNPSFDRDFLINTSNRYHINWPLAYRTIDLHSVAFFHMIKHSLAPPVKNNRSDLNLDRILEYVGLFVARKKHNALEDALLEAEAMNRLFYDRNLLEEYAHFPIPWTKTN
jgi:DNA polymerase III epsilon subunit-like protein